MELLTPDIIERLLEAPMLLLVLYIVFVLQKRLRSQDGIITLLIEKLSQSFKGKGD